MKMTRTVNNRQDFLADCADYCDTFKTQLGDNRLMIAYVRRGKRPSKNIFIKGEDGTLKAAARGRRKPQGVIVAFKDDDGTIMVGWSLCRKNETFHSKVGLRYAIERAIPLEQLQRQLENIDDLKATFENNPTGMAAATPDGYPPHSVRAMLTHFLERTEKL
jgi:hypothetical protein